jgi:hypothetical protein
MKQYVRYLIFCCLANGFMADVSAQGNINKVEYFFDADPGFGNGTNVAVSPSSNISGLLFNADVSTIAPGMHTLFVRSKSANNKWSLSNKLVFAKFQPPFATPNVVSNIVNAEYFYDLDPGFGNATNIPVTAATDIPGMLINVNTGSIGYGMHTLYLRTKDASGIWSLSGKLIFARFQAPFADPNALSRVNKLEYFFNTDPGPGNGTDVPVTSTFDMAGLIVNADVSTLQNGMNTLYIRSRDSLGEWSIANRMIFAKVQPVFPNSNTISNIVKAEYYYDTDPGFYGGVNIPVVPATDISAMVFNADVSAIPGGVHTLYVRTQDAQGKWSVVSRTVFAKIQPLSGNPLTTSNINRIEYFIDTDPGIGNGYTVAFTNAVDVNNLSFNVDMTVIANNIHGLYVRSRDVSGRWSITNRIDFTGGTAPLGMKLLSFDASLNTDNTVLLEWMTAAEDHVANYLVERSSDASAWTLVGKKDPVTPSSSERRTYRLTDLTPGKGIVYYRLTEVDMNGTTTRAPIRFVRIGDDKGSYASVYPNPNDGAHINISSDIFEEGQVAVTVMGADGKMAFQQLINNNSNTLTISDLQLAAGHYFINLQSSKRSESLKLEVIAK